MQIKGNIKALRHWPLCGEFTGDRWIPRTNGQLRGKCFHFMMSSWDSPCFKLLISALCGSLTHWGWMTHICNSRLSTIGSYNGLSPSRRQAIIWTNAEILLIRTIGTNFSEILSVIHTFSFKKMHLKMSSGKWRPFCLGLLMAPPTRAPQTSNWWHLSWDKDACSVSAHQHCLSPVKCRKFF